MFMKSIFLSKKLDKKAHFVNKHRFLPHSEKNMFIAMNEDA